MDTGEERPHWLRDPFWSLLSRSDGAQASQPQPESAGSEPAAASGTSSSVFQTVRERYFEVIRELDSTSAEPDAFPSPP
jgi:hypothetical protein